MPAVVVPQVFCRAISVMLGLRSRFHPFIRGATFKSLKDLPFAEMVRRLREDPELRRRMALEGVANVYGADDPSDPFAGQMNLEWDKVYALGNPPVYEPSPGQSIETLTDSFFKVVTVFVLMINLIDTRARLLAIMKEFSRTDLNFHQRLNDIMNGGGLNGSFVLNADPTLGPVTVFDDGAADVLNAGGTLDWFFIHKKDDLINGRLAGDKVTLV